MPREEVRAEDLEVCRRMLRDGSKSFAAASRLLPRRVREPATVLYAFCRLCDDRVDADPCAPDAAVGELRGRLERAYRDRPDDHPVDRALAVVVRREGVPFGLLDALLEGLAWDVRGRRYETIEELYAYAARVAGAVGAMMTLLMGRRGETVLARACDLGVAMQLTNIARDVGEDARRGRVYVPLTWLREAGVDPEAWLTAPVASEPIRAVTARLLQTADALYARADAGIAKLPVDCRVAIRGARLIYADIGRGVARAGFDSVSRRAVVPTRRKVWLLLRALGGLWLRSSAQDQPPLEPVRFLLRACGPAS